jgi:hypothetical protein
MGGKIMEIIPVSKAEYAEKETEFMARTDALCEDAPPATCDCSVCPCKGLCDWLCSHEAI